MAKTREEILACIEFNAADECTARQKYFSLINDIKESSGFTEAEKAELIPMFEEIIGDEFNHTQLELDAVSRLSGIPIPKE